MRGEKQSQVAHQGTAEYIGQKETVHQVETAHGRMLQVQMQDLKTEKEQKITR